jgi:hypothetical protein
MGEKPIEVPGRNSQQQQPSLGGPAAKEPSASTPSSSTRSGRHQGPPKPILILLPGKAGEEVIAEAEAVAAEAVAAAAAAVEDVGAGENPTALPKVQGMLRAGMEGMPETVALQTPTVATPHLLQPIPTERVVRTARQMATRKRLMGHPEPANHQLRGGTAEAVEEAVGDGTSVRIRSRRQRRRRTPRTIVTRTRPMTLNPTAPSRRAAGLKNEAPHQFNLRSNQSEINRKRTRRMQGRVVKTRRNRLRMVGTVRRPC